MQIQLRLATSTSEILIFCAFKWLENNVFRFEILKAIKCVNGSEIPNSKRPGKISIFFKEINTNIREIKCF